MALLTVLIFIYGLGLLVFVVLAAVARIHFEREKQGPVKPALLIVLIQDQGRIAEGFLRRLVSQRNLFWPALKVMVIDTGSRDDTPEILRILVRKGDVNAFFPSSCSPGNIGDLMEDGFNQIWRYDARDRDDRSLLKGVFLKGPGRFGKDFAVT